jgi:hypothetical protein
MTDNSITFRHQSVRDLAWAVSSSPLVSTSSYACFWPGQRWYQQLHLQSFNWLKTVDEDPAELEALLSRQRDKRLGKYFETLWFYWLSHNPRYEVVANNLQIILEGETLGEIDFIVLDKDTGRTVHWELAVKFYLGTGDTRRMSNWFGPNTHDRLDIKVDHLMHKQSVITSNLKVQQWLQQQGIVIDQCAVVLKGRLYFPWKTYNDVFQRKISMELISPRLYSKESLSGCWFKLEEFEQLFTRQDRFIPLINEGWLEKIPDTGTGKARSKSGILDAVNSNELRLPLHLMVSREHEHIERFFLVDDNWPG